MENQSNFSDLDKKYMHQALELARQGLGRVAPNPSVGCIIVKDGIVLGTARTQDGGRPHAEAHALSTLSGSDLEGSTAYVTLEPCSHFGKTPPCAQALIDARIARVVVACVDSDPRVSGQGVKMLRAEGVKVDVGLYEAEALELNAGFFLRLHSNRPWITLKMAVSADGKIAGAQGQAVQISCEKSKIHMHQNLRACHDGIVIGANTACLDNPSLTTRYLPAGQQHKSTRFVLGDVGAVPSDALIFAGQDVNQTINITSKSLREALSIMAEQHGMTRILVEGGAQLMTSLLNENLWDELWLYNSPIIIGADGIQVPDFSAYPKSKLSSTEIDVDRLEIYRPQD